MQRADIKKNIFYYTLLIMTLIIAIIGATYATYIFLHKQKEGTSAVYTGTLTINYISGDIIKCQNLIPIETPNFNTKDRVYRNNFQVKNTGTLNSLVTIYLDINTNEFSDNNLFYSLYNKNGEIINESKLKGTGTIEVINNMLLKTEEMTEYTLLIWLKENGENQNEDMRKKLTGKIRVEANQNREE